jgi:chaperonin cofactor prefoldin
MMNEPNKPTIDDALAAITTLQDATALSFTRVDTTIDALRTDMNTRFDLVDNRFDEVNQRFDLVDNRFDEVNQRFDRLETRFDGLESRFDRLETRFDRLETLIITSKPKRKRSQDRE